MQNLVRSTTSSNKNPPTPPVNHSYQYYIYAPKADRYLRRLWAEPWPATDHANLQQLSQVYQQTKIDWGIGITPFEIHHNFDDHTKANLDAKIRSINEFQPNILAILFDDMRGDDANIAQIQADVTHRIMEQSTASSFMMCPTYYSTDPVLDKVFGDRPSHYLETLGQLLDPAVQIFWTGEKVCSQHYSIEHLQAITAQLGRKPYIWDNYPVNDGAKLCKFLHLRPCGFQSPQSQELVDWLQGEYPFDPACLTE